MLGSWFGENRMWRTLTAPGSGGVAGRLQGELEDVALLVGRHRVGDRLVVELLAEDLARDLGPVLVDAEPRVLELLEPGRVDLGRGHSVTLPIR